MDRAGGQPLRENAGGGHGAGGDEDMKALAGQPLHQRQQSEALADAGAMQPGQPSLRSRRLGNSAALADPLEIFLALLSAPPQEQPAERREAGGGGAVNGQKHRRTHCSLVSLKRHVEGLHARCASPAPRLMALRRDSERLGATLTGHSG